MIKTFDLSLNKKMKSTKKNCRKVLSRKIGINIREKKYRSRQQAIAVAYSQVNKSHPRCKRFFKRKSKGKRSKFSTKKKI